jgi:hypothetical protein
MCQPVVGWAVDTNSVIHHAETWVEWVRAHHPRDQKSYKQWEKMCNWELRTRIQTHNMTKCGKGYPQTVQPGRPLKPLEAPESQWIENADPS